MIEPKLSQSENSKEAQVLAESWKKIWHWSKIEI
jgi:hypothetical protein